MSERSQLLEALRDIKDPELGISIVELGLVKKVELEGKKVQVHVDLTIAACPLKDQIKHSVEEAVAKAVPGSTLELTLGAMTPAELLALRERLGAQRSEAIGKGAQTPGKLGENAGGINLLPKRVPLIVAVGSGKGGVGKSSVTAQLACALQRLGKQVGILDADITGPSIARIFGSKEKPKVKADEPDIIIPVDTAAGVKILSMNLLIADETAPVLWRGPLINGAIRQLYSNAAWEGVEILLIDMPPGTSDATLTIYQSLPIDGVVIVTTPQALVGMIVAKSLSMAKTMRVPIFGLVENLAYVMVPERKEPFYLFGALKGEGAAKIFDVPYWGALPIDPALAQACDKGTIQTIDAEPVRHMALELLKKMPVAAGK
jgi:ATP-binding protein involved in chromosome partitioning